MNKLHDFSDYKGTFSKQQWKNIRNKMCCYIFIPNIACLRIKEFFPKTKYFESLMTLFDFILLQEVR